MRNYLLLLLLWLFACCSSENGMAKDNNLPEIPTDTDEPAVKSSKPKGIWVDAEANMSRLNTKEGIDYYAKKIKETGFTEVYVDVKPSIGYAMYNSNILPRLTKWGDNTMSIDWDYLAYWIEVGKRDGLDIVPTISTLSFGDTRHKQGLVYDDKSWNDKMQMRMKNNDGSLSLLDIRNDNDNQAHCALLNPVIPEVQSLVLKIVGEIATNYPDIKGICLDYCRWLDANYGMSDATINSLNADAGLHIDNRNDIITASGAPRRYYNQWIAFRSKVISNLVTNIRNRLKSIDASKKLYLWSSADWKTRYTVGQNWASSRYVPSGFPYASDYNKTGFADKLDVFLLGAYADAVWKKDALNSHWSVENFVTTYNEFIKGDCKVYGSIGTYENNYVTNPQLVSDGVYLCLKNTDGLMVFDLVHVINNNQWEEIKDGINRAEK